VEQITIRLDYICNPASVRSEGVDSFGDAQLGVINWNTCLLYPDNTSIDDILVSATLQLPKGWRFGTALKTAENVPGKVTFASETLRQFVDSPVRPPALQHPHPTHQLPLPVPNGDCHGGQVGYDAGKKIKGTRTLDNLLSCSSSVVPRLVRFPMWVLTQ
jgi:hypothetical protein